MCTRATVVLHAYARCLSIESVYLYSSVHRPSNWLILACNASICTGWRPGSVVSYIYIVHDFFIELLLNSHLLILGVVKSLISVDISDVDYFFVLFRLRSYDHVFVYGEILEDSSIGVQL